MSFDAEIVKAIESGAPVRVKGGWNERRIQQSAKIHGRLVNDVCCICLRKITTQIYRNSGVCSEQCRKDRDNDHAPFQPVNLRVHEGEDK